MWICLFYREFSPFTRGSSRFRQTAGHASGCAGRCSHIRKNTASWKAAGISTAARGAPGASTAPQNRAQDEAADHRKVAPGAPQQRPVVLCQPVEQGVRAAAQVPGAHGGGKGVAPGPSGTSPPAGRRRRTPARSPRCPTPPPGSGPPPPGPGSPPAAPYAASGSRPGCRCSSFTASATSTPRAKAPMGARYDAASAHRPLRRPDPQQHHIPGLGVGEHHSRALRPRQR